MQKNLTIIAAVSNNDVLGFKGDLPWHIPEDLKRFKKLTMGHPVIMGRKTFENILKRLGKPLPGRENIVLSQTMSKNYPGIHVARNTDYALHYLDGREGFVIGGKKIFQDFYSNVSKMELTRIYKDFKGDVFFPEIDWGDWYLVDCKEGETEKGLEYDFLTYRKKF